MIKIKNNDAAQKYFLAACSSGNFNNLSKENSPSFTELLDLEFTLYHEKNPNLLHAALSPWPNKYEERCLIIKKLIELGYFPERQNRHEVSCLELAKAKLIIEQHNSSTNSKRYKCLKQIIELFEKSRDTRRVKAF